MPAENIKRSIQRGTGEVEGAAFEEVTYEGYGPGGAAIILECYTENRNRTVADIRHAFSKHGGNLAENGSVGWQFKHVGEITIERGKLDPDEVTLSAIDGGAEDVEVDEESIVVYTPVADLHACNDSLLKAGIKTKDVILTYKPTNMAKPEGADVAKLLKLLDALEDLDDVQESYVNVDITEDMLQEA